MNLSYDVCCLIIIAIESKLLLPFIYLYSLNVYFCFVTICSSRYECFHLLSNCGKTMDCLVRGKWKNSDKYKILFRWFLFYSLAFRPWLCSLWKSVAFYQRKNSEFTSYIYFYKRRIRKYVFTWHTKEIVRNFEFNALR